MQLRQANPNDFNFVANSYLKSYRYSPETKHLISQIYYDMYKERLKNMLASGEVTVACSDEDPDQILGYIIAGTVHGKPLVHYVYVKHVFRKMGVAKALLLAVVPGWGTRMVICTHTARRFTELREKYKLIYNSEYASQK